MKTISLLLAIIICVSFCTCLICKSETIINGDNENTVFIFKNELILRDFCKKRLAITTNNGDSWHYIYLPQDFSNLYFTDSQHGWAFDDTNPSRLWKTANGGVNWEIIYTFQTDYVISAEEAIRLLGVNEYQIILKKLSSQIVIIKTPYSLDSRYKWFIDGYNLWATVDGGEEWKIIYTFQTGYAITVKKAIELFGVEHYQTIIKKLRPQIVIVDETQSTNVSDISECVVDERPLIGLFPSLNRCHNFSNGYREAINGFSIPISGNIYQYNNGFYFDALFEWSQYDPNTGPVIDIYNIGLSLNKISCKAEGDLIGYFGVSTGILRDRSNDLSRINLYAFAGIKMFFLKTNFSKRHAKSPFSRFGVDVMFGKYVLPNEFAPWTVRIGIIWLAGKDFYPH